MKQTFNPMCNDTKSLMEMLSYCRPNEHPTELAFIETYLLPIGFEYDHYGNLFLIIPNKDGTPSNILWSSHSDTVHTSGGMQTTHYNPVTGDISLSRKSKKTSSCLGADCTTGIWLQLEMIKHKVPGLYIIHYGEELGCLGSSALASDPRGLLDGIDIAIAFDRYGYDEIITHQMGERCCSDAFARSLSLTLFDESANVSMAPSPNGAFTDTYEYLSIIPECTNIAVGYWDQHSTREVQNMPHLKSLRDALIAGDFTSLVVRREPNKSVPYDSGKWGRQEWDIGYERDVDLRNIVIKYPDVVASILESYGISKYDVVDEIERHYGEFVE